MLSSTREGTREYPGILKFLHLLVLEYRNSVAHKKAQQFSVLNDKPWKIVYPIFKIKMPLYLLDMALVIFFDV